MQHCGRRLHTTDFPNNLIDVPSEFQSPGASRDLIINRNPFWVVGDMVRLHPFSYPDGCTSHEGLIDSCMVFPAYVNGTLTSDINERWTDSRILQRSWFWLGWMLDPALTYSGTGWRTITGDYFYALLQEQYQAHYAFVLAKMSVEKAMAASWSDSSGRAVKGHGMWASSRAFLIFKNSEYGRPAMSGDLARKDFETKWFVNTARMWMLLVDNEVNTRHQVFDKWGTYTAMRYARLWIQNLSPNDPDAVKWDTLLEHIRTGISSIKEEDDLRKSSDLFGMYDEITTKNTLPGNEL